MAGAIVLELFGLAPGGAIDPVPPSPFRATVARTLPPGGHLRSAWRELRSAGRLAASG